MTIQLVLAATEGYLRRFETPTTPQELSRHRIVRLSSPRPYITLTDADGEQHRVDTLAQLETNDSRTAQRAVRAGLGIGLSSTRALHRDPHLRRVMADYRLPRISLAAIYARASRPSWPASRSPWRRSPACRARPRRLPEPPDRRCSVVSDNEQVTGPPSGGLFTGSDGCRGPRSNGRNPIFHKQA